MTGCMHAPTNEASQEGISELMKSRTTMYDLLARVYHKEVDENFLAELRAMRYPQNSDNSQVNEAFRHIYAYLRHAPEDVLDELAVDYGLVFLGAGKLNPEAAYPYESVYTSTHALLMQEARDEALAIYRSQGIDKNESWKDPEDHIALELEFMATMSRRTAQAIRDANDDAARSLIATQHGFMTHHLLNWVPRFLVDVPRYARTDFYKAFAQLTGAFLSDDLELVEDIAHSSGIELAQGGETNA